MFVNVEMISEVITAHLFICYIGQFPLEQDQGIEINVLLMRNYFLLMQMTMTVQ
jgi:hypothetical protein